MKIFWSLLTCLFVCAATNKAVSAQNDESKLFNSIFSKIYNMQFDDAEKELLESKNMLENLKFQILYIDLFWWKTIDCNCEKESEHFKEIVDKFPIGLENTTAKNNLEELIIRSYKVRLYSYQNHYFNLVIESFKINRLLNTIENERLTPEYSELFGLYKAIFSMKNDFWSSSKMKSSTIQLQQYALSTNLIIKTISTYFLAKNYYDIEKKPEKALPYFNELTTMYPQNSIFKNYLKLCYN